MNVRITIPDEVVDGAEHQSEQGASIYDFLCAATPKLLIAEYERYALEFPGDHPIHDALMRRVLELRSATVVIVE